MTEPHGARCDSPRPAAADGYNAYIFELPGLGVGDIVESSVALDAFVGQVLADTGAAEVDLVGHSQGGLVARYYVKYLGGDGEVDSLVMLGTPNYGTALANLGDDTRGSVEYTNIYSSFDEIMFPASTSRLRNGATNVRLQRHCALRVVGHLGLLADGAVYDGVRDALRHRSAELLRLVAAGRSRSDTLVGIRRCLASAASSVSASLRWTRR